ncbi:putative secreted protein (Por secretion system target) [Dyadobacter jejuensis]|uniref:Putative secreted protein (Por secretion system target) n=2 Tax=Dyadobacter jejuensis TaxID=1082580 RepID=A0A316APL8_9BACT|nr:putative secreted protein (Por secretion system target) [Dyadobacter jejuensis]
MLLKYCLLPMVLSLCTVFYCNGQERCGTMSVLDNKFSTQPNLRTNFELQRSTLTKRANESSQSGTRTNAETTYTIPVVFHVVTNSRITVSQQAIYAQLDTLNKDYGGKNAGRAQVLSAFASLVGEANIQFCLAQRTPDGRPSDGIEFTNTTVSSFDYESEDVKYASRGGADAWDTDRYLNIWICSLSDDILGYATFPDLGPAVEQGVVIDYNSLPGGSSLYYSAGKTLTHEVGHFFGLYHIWGDDKGACTGSDEVADTPNQADYTQTCRQGEVMDACSRVSPGIMYQNFMDYTPDACLVMFSQGQVTRMRSALENYRMSLATSDGCTPVDLMKNDASIKSILAPAQRLCEGQFTPQIVIQNKGEQALTRLTITVQQDDDLEAEAITWTGNLNYYEEATITLPTLTTGVGEHVLRVRVENPNGLPDEQTSDDVLEKAFIYYEPFEAPVQESFETVFPSPGWDIVNPDASVTWEQNTSASVTGGRSVRILNYNYTSVGQVDLLRSPVVKVAGVDSAFVSFSYAASNYSTTTTQWDTLSVLVSTDCGQTYVPLYQEWGGELATRAATRSSFVPAITEWKRVELNLAQFIGQGEVMVAFGNTNGHGNNIYLDDILIRTVVVNPNLKEAGFLVSPNPTSDQVKVEFYPHPDGLQSVTLYTVSGKKVKEYIIEGEVSTNVYTFNLQNYASGVYVVRARFKDKVMTKKIVKY